MKTVWITGSSSGIGKALAHEFNAQGFFTILSARRTNVLVEVQSQLPFPENSAILTLDLNEFKKASTWCNEALRSTGNIDILINNGGMGHLGSVTEMELNVEEQVMNTNLWGSVALTKAVLPHMIERGSGQIWTVASILGFFWQPKIGSLCCE